MGGCRHRGGVYRRGAGHSVVHGAQQTRPRRVQRKRATGGSTGPGLHPAQRAGAGAAALVPPRHLLAAPLGAAECGGGQAAAVQQPPEGRGERELCQRWRWAPAAAGRLLVRGRRWSLLGVGVVQPLRRGPAGSLQVGRGAPWGPPLHAGAGAGLLGLRLVLGHARGRALDGGPPQRRRAERPQRPARRGRPHRWRRRERGGLAVRGGVLEDATTGP
mmetsp:Transcript_83342/g.210044  ORF Transcript_83342/g.210044 Transcript_83342/m.210044 type:complete len:217 (-) Transcript_83342:136-786(-)